MIVLFGAFDRHNLGDILLAHMAASSVGAEHVLLRPGPMKRQELSFTTFENTWQRSERWAFVALPPGRLPAMVTEAEASRALVAFERNSPPSASATAHGSGS